MSEHERRTGKPRDETARQEDAPDYEPPRLGVIGSLDSLTHGVTEEGGPDPAEMSAA